MRRFSRLLVGALLALPLLWLSGGEALAGSTLYGTLRGKVADDKGEPLVGVTVQVRSPELVRDVVRINAYVTDRAHLGAYMAVRDRLFADPAPASTLMIVSGFARPEFKVEIEVIAAG